MAYTVLTMPASSFDLRRLFLYQHLEDITFPPAHWQDSVCPWVCVCVCALVRLQICEHNFVTVEAPSWRHFSRVARRVKRRRVSSICGQRPARPVASPPATHLLRCLSTSAKVGSELICVSPQFLKEYTDFRRQGEFNCLCFCDLSSLHTTNVRSFIFTGLTTKLTFFLFAKLVPLASSPTLTTLKCHPLREFNTATKKKS